MPSIRTRHTRSGQIRYRAEVRLTGFSHRSKTFAKKADAKAWAAQTESTLLSQRNADTGQPTRTLNDVIDR